MFIIIQFSALLVRIIINSEKPFGLAYTGEREKGIQQVEALNIITTPPMAFLAVMSVGYFIK
jgi:hypothetical protein